jgi:hypothetical protein
VRSLPRVRRLARRAESGRVESEFFRSSRPPRNSSYRRASVARIKQLEERQMPVRQQRPSQREAQEVDMRDSISTMDQSVTIPVGEPTWRATCRYRRMPPASFCLHTVVAAAGAARAIARCRAAARASVRRRCCSISLPTTKRASTTRRASSVRHRLPCRPVDRGN